MSLKKNRFDNRQLKSGYEAMGQINLSFAEACLESDARDFFTYENHLVTTSKAWVGDQSDD